MVGEAPLEEPDFKQKQSYTMSGVAQDMLV